MRMDLSPRQLRALVEVVEKGTFTDAAIAMGTPSLTGFETPVGLMQMAVHRGRRSPCLPRYGGGLRSEPVQPFRGFRATPWWAHDWPRRQNPLCQAEVRHPASCGVA
jgi:hypothetical protein